MSPHVPVGFFQQGFGLSFQGELILGLLSDLLELNVPLSHHLWHLRLLDVSPGDDSGVCKAAAGEMVKLDATAQHD